MRATDKIVADLVSRVDSIERNLASLATDMSWIKRFLGWMAGVGSIMTASILFDLYMRVVKH